jgi:two-component system phosphate regulon sensor histidine kinase PhoR
MRFSQLSFRQKILISYILLFIVFLTLLFPFASESVRTIVYKTFKQRALDLISNSSKAKNLNDLIRDLNLEQQKLFFRVTLIKPDGEVLYDSFPKEEKFLRKPLPDEIVEALEGGTGYNEEFSPLMGQELIYVARAFTFDKQILVLRAAFPFKQFDELISDFELGFLSLGSIILLLFAILTWSIMHHLSKPIQRIIKLVKPYQDGLQDTIPKIYNDSHLNKQDDFGKLAVTLNSLSEKIQSHIDTLMMERKKQETILESLGEGIIAVDNNLNVTYANKIALELLDTKKETLLEHNFEKTEFSKCGQLLSKCLDENIIRASSLKLPQKMKYLELIAVPMQGEKGAVLVLQDKSTHYKMIEMGKDFVANASHELKTPITIIRGFAETLSDHPELPKEVFVEIIKKIVRNCERMETLVRNLLTLADIENLPRTRLQECNILELIENCKQIVLNVYGKAHIDVIRDKNSETHIIADQDLLELAIVNLLTNAAKYSHGPAVIIVELKQFDKKHIEISIKDKGIGIPKEDIEHIFNRFYTVDKAHSRKLGGSGLGLSITKTIIEKHKGKISVTSLIGEGTEFKVQLPIELENIENL